MPYDGFWNNLHLESRVSLCTEYGRIGVRRQNPILEDIGALMPYFRTAEKYKYLNYYYTCLNNQSTWLLPALLGYMNFATIQINASPFSGWLQVRI
ncbi:hypothetical protein ACN38_g3352 [Penicillium nordicum]|uniref:Uncharacterized protein n=1 Tax=Penicillium nordicum TaxID=229535 RepID=A0A0M8PD67_9EURO|nr:hypothetical protein ACN38_g3352 [Penicillium nordicum]